MQTVETCRWCNITEVVPKGKEVYEGREVNIVYCPRCGITLVSTKDLPLLDNAFKCGNRKCEQNSKGWCRLDSRCERFVEPKPDEKLLPERVKKRV